MRPDITMRPAQDGLTAESKTRTMRNPLRMAALGPGLLCEMAAGTVTLTGAISEANGNSIWSALTLVRREPFARRTGPTTVARDCKELPKSDGVEVLKR